MLEALEPTMHETVFPKSWQSSPNIVIWLLCHYPETEEADERIRQTVRIHNEWDWPIWIYGSCSARYPESVEWLLKQKLIQQGVRPEAIFCSGDPSQSTIVLDTVQEAYNVAADAKRRGVRVFVCISNRLHLLQVRALLRREPIEFVWVATPLRDRRWWYVAGRLFLIPLAFMGIGYRFPPLILVRWARARLAHWPF